MSGGMLCGGFDNSTIGRSCLTFISGKWQDTDWTLWEERSFHISWTRLDGQLRLLGGTGSSGTSSEIVSETGSSVGFPLKYSTR